MAQLTRRQFIRRLGWTATASVFPTIIPARVLGRHGMTPPSDKITMGCIGLGGQGTYNMMAFLNQNDVQVVALCDVEAGSDLYDMLYQFQGTTAAGLAPALERLTKFYQEQTNNPQWSGCETYRDFRELLSRRDIDAVSVCTPDHWHGLISIAAAEAGKDVYCEKPLVNTVAEGRVVSDTVKRYSRVLQTGSHERSNDSVRFATELVRNGRIGKVHTININMPVDSSLNIPPQKNEKCPASLDYNMWLGPTPWYPYTRKRSHFWWRYILEYGGGEMTDRGAHVIDLAQLILDMDSSGPVRFAGKGEAPRRGLFDSFTSFDFTCQYQNGVQMIGKSVAPRGLKIVGSDGWIFIHIHGGRLEAEPESLLRERIGPGEIHVGRSPGHHRDFLDKIKSRGLPMASAEIGHRTASICHLINIALLTGRELQWDPAAEQIVNDSSANRMVRHSMRPPWRL